MERLTTEKTNQLCDNDLFCGECNYYGEPNGCNRNSGTCKAYDYFTSVYDRLAELEQKLADGRMVELHENWIETLKLLTISAICYQNNQNKIIEKMKGGKDIANLFIELPTVQYTSNHIKLLRLLNSNIDVNKITNINEIIDIFYPKADAEKALEGLK